MPEWLLLAVLTFGAAVLYASVGHGGASGYLAAMALVGMAPASIKPTALVLNLLVAGAGSVRYLRSGWFSWKAFWPFAATSVPFAFLGGATTPPDDVYRRLLGLVLVSAAVALVVRKAGDREPRPLWAWAGLPIGAAMGFISGLIGIGGGIFLSPLLILAGWATVRQTLGIASLFVFSNSLAGLLGHSSSVSNLPSEIYWLAPTAFVGGLLGSSLGSRAGSTVWISRALAVVLLIAAMKLFL
jgi:uncharacterized protein